MKSVLSPSNFATGMTMEEQSFTWTIENFPVLRMHQSTIDSQKIYFSAGSSLRHPTKWEVFLQEKLIDEKRWIGIYLKLNSPKPTDPAFHTWYSGIRFTIKNKEGVIIKDNDTKPIHFGTKFVESPSWGFEKFIDAEDDSICTEGRLVIYITFQLYTPSKDSHSHPKLESASSLESIMEKFQDKFSDKLRKDLSGLLKNPIPSSDIKIISSDRKEFSMPRGVLAVRSEVFAAMLSSDMIEASSGVINLPDISSRALQVLLTFMFAGGLDPDWSHTEVLVDLTNAAAKYQLLDLLQFLDATLGTVCKKENVLPLFTLAQRLQLKTAEVELSKYFREHSISPEDCYKMSFSGLDGSVHSLPKRKSRFWTLLSNPFKGMFAKN